MEAKFLVLEESARQFQGKTGLRKTYELSLRDRSPGLRCSNNFTYSATDEEVDKYKGKLRDTEVTVEISRIMAGFNGELRLEGRIKNGVPPTKGS